MSSERTDSRARRAFLFLIGRGDGLPSSDDVISAANAPSATGASSGSTSSLASRTDCRARRAAVALAAQGVGNPTVEQVVAMANRSYGDG